MQVLSTKRNLTRYAAIAALACQQYLAISLLYAVIPVILRSNGANLELIGLFSTLFFSFTINFLWAPVVDRYSLGRIGLRRSWILAMQVGSAAGMLLLALLNPAADFYAVFVVGCGLATLVATQRISTLGYIAEALEVTERPFGTAVYGWGAAVGSAIGGAAFLRIIEAVGWRPALLGFALLLSACAAGVLAIPEPKRPQSQISGIRPGASLWDMLQYARLWRVAAVIAPAVFGVAVAFAMVFPRLVDLGFAVSDIGSIGALAHVATFTVAGPLTSAAVTRSPGRRGVVLACLALAACFVLLAIGAGSAGESRGAIAAVCLVFAALAIQHVVFSTWFLTLAQPGEAATDVTFLSAMMSAAALAGFAASGFIATRFGYGMTFALAAGGYAATAILVACAPSWTEAHGMLRESDSAA